MAFERLSRIFRRRRQSEAGDDPSPGLPELEREEVEETDEPTHTPSIDKPGSNAVLIDQMEDGFKYIGRVMDKVDRHIDHQSQVMENFRQVADRLPGMVDSIGEGAQANRALVERMGQYVGEHDQAQQGLLHGLQDLNQALREERDEHRGQLDMVMRIHRSQRRFMALLVLFLALLCCCLLVLVLAMALRPDLIASRTGAGPSAGRGTDAPANGDIWSRDRRALLDEAAASGDPLIRDLADSAR